MATFVSDSFTDALNTPLPDHTGETGATWTEHPNYTGNIGISASNRLTALEIGGGICYASGLPASPNYVVQADIVVYNSAGTDYPSLIGRCSPTVSTFYWLSTATSECAWLTGRSCQSAERR